MSHDQTFWHIKWKHKLRPIYGPSLSTIPFVYGELLKKNHNFQEFRFFCGKFHLYSLKRSKKNVKAGRLAQIMACSINLRQY